MHIEWMMRRLLIYVLVGPLLAGDGCRRRDAQASRPAGAYTQGNGRAGGGMGPTMGEGRLTLLNGTAHAFSVNGLNLQGRVGSSIDLEAKGEVYNLQRLGDFAGTYRRAIGVVDPERPTNTLILENEQECITVTVTVALEHTDVRILPSESASPSRCWE